MSNNTAQEAVARLDFARRSGVQYEGARDVYKVAGYKRTLGYQDYRGYYDRHPVAARIIDLPVTTSWRYDPVVVETDVEDETPFQRQVAELAKRTRLWSRMQAADTLARIGRYSVIVIGAADGLPLSRPLERLSGPDGVAYFAHYNESAAQINTWVTDPADERFGQPETYLIDLSRGNATFRAGRELVHWTRVVHIAEGLLDDDVYGRPALRRVMNTLFDEEKVTAAASEGFWQLADQILTLSVDPGEGDLSEEEQAAIQTAVQEIFHDLRRHVIAKNANMQWIGGNPSDPSGLVDWLSTKIATGAGIAKRILFGSERGELASSQDERQWVGSIVERQETLLGPDRIRPLIDRLIDLGALDRPNGGTYEIQWENLFQLTDEEVQKRNLNTAQTAAALTPAGGDPYELVEVDSDRNVWLRPSGEVWDERDKMAAEMPELPPMPGEDAQEEEDEEEADG